MTVTFDWDDEQRLAKARMQLEPLARELEARSDMAQVTLVPIDGVLVCRFVRADGERYDTGIGLRPLADMLANARTLRTGVDVLLRRVTALMAAQVLAKRGILVGVQGSMLPN